MIDYNSIPDEDLYGMCIEGDEGAWRYIYCYVLAICQWKKWGLKIESEDLAQQVTLHLLEKAIKQVKEKTKFRNFLKIVAINQIKDRFKRASLQKEKPGIYAMNKYGEEWNLEIVDPKPLYEKTLMDLEIVRTIDKAVDKLPKNCQTVIHEYLKFKMGFYKDYSELSRVLKMHIPTISSKVRRCLNKLLEMREIRELMTAWKGEKDEM